MFFLQFCSENKELNILLQSSIVKIITLILFREFFERKPIIGRDTK